jgi:carbon storage regulator
LLVLTRHVHQSIVIGHDVIVTVLEVRGDQVRLGITAPKDIQVHREEVFAALTAANRQAATSASELEVLKELSSEPIGSSPDRPRQGPEAGPSAAGPSAAGPSAAGPSAAGPRRGPGMSPPPSPDSASGQQSGTGPGSRQPATGHGPGHSGHSGHSGTGPSSGPSASASPPSAPTGPSTSGSPTSSRSTASPSAAVPPDQSK